MVGLRGAALAWLAFAVACATASTTAGPELGTGPIQGETCPAALQPLRRYLAITSVGDVHERQGRPQRTVIAREVFALPVFITPEADFIDIRWQVSPDFEEVLSVEVGVVVRDEPADAVVPDGASWVEVDDPDRGRLVALHDVKALSRAVLPAAARLVQSGEPQPFDALTCERRTPPPPVEHRHRWPVWIRGELDGESISERVVLEFETQEAFDPGGTAASLQWRRGQYVLDAKAWLAASYEPGWDTDVEFRVHVQDSLGRSFDHSGGAVASADFFVGSSEHLGLGTIELGRFPRQGAPAHDADAEELRSLRHWAGPCASNAACPPGVACMDGKCVTELAAERGSDRCIEVGDRIECQCGDGHRLGRWRGLDSTSSSDLRLRGLLFHTCNLGRGIALDGAGPSITVTFAPVMTIAHES